VAGRARCRMHDGAKGSGGPRGPRNGNYKHGRYTAEAKQRRLQLGQWIRNQLRETRETINKRGTDHELLSRACRMSQSIATPIATLCDAPTVGIAHGAIASVKPRWSARTGSPSGSSVHVGSPQELPSVLRRPLYSTQKKPGRDEDVQSSPSTTRPSGRPPCSFRIANRIRPRTSLVAQVARCGSPRKFRIQPLESSLCPARSAAPALVCDAASSP
jgi:hypothetical protein